MTTIGIHGFVWTGSSDQSALERAMEKTAELGYQAIEFPRLDPGRLDIPSLARRLEALDLGVVVTMGLPFDADISSTDPETVARGEAVLLDAVSVARDLGATKLGGIIFSAHGKYNALPSAEGHANSIDTLRRVAPKRGQRLADQRLAVRAWNQRRPVHQQRKRPEFALARDIGHGLMPQPTRHQQRIADRRFHQPVKVAQQLPAIQFQMMRQQHLGIQPVDLSGGLSQQIARPDRGLRGRAGLIFVPLVTHPAPPAAPPHPPRSAPKPARPARSLP